MTSYVIFFGLLCTLYLLSMGMTRYMSLLFFTTVKNQSVVFFLIAVLFFPGVFIHELAHFLFAIVVGVRAGHIEFVPKLIDNRLKLGSVQIEKTDPFRKTWIGIAPLVCGLGMLLLSVYILKTFFSDSLLAFLIVGLLYFQISNTMFSSKKDLEGTGVFFILVILSGMLLWLFHVPVIAILTTSDVGIIMRGLLEKASLYLGIAVAIDVALLLVMIGISKIRV